jgi:tetratricopeptide (TPR) repeat protein
MRISGNVNLRQRIENQYLLGTCAFFMGDYAAAGENLEQAKKSAQSMRGNDVYPWVQLAQYQTFNALRQKEPDQIMNRLSKAASTLEEASRRQAVNPTILKLLAQAYIRLNRFPEARDTLQKLVTVDPENIPARFDLAGLSHLLGDDRSAIEQYQQILERQSGHVMANFNLGSIFLARASYPDAVRRLKVAVENDPTFLDARINLAQAYLGRNEYELAKKEYEQALQLNPENMQAILGLGMIYQRQGNFIEAERYLRDAVEAAPNSDQVRVLLAKLYLQKGNLTSAIRELEKAIELNSKNFQAKIQLGNAYLETGLRHNINSAVEIFEQMQDNPSSAVKREAMSGLALAMLARGEFDTAQEQFNRILNLPDLSNTDKAQIYVNIGNAYLKQEQNERARTNYEKALTLDRTLAESHYNLGRLYHKEERYADARLKYNMAIGSNPNLAPAHYNLAQLYDQRNNLDKAEEHYEIAIDKDPGLAEAYLNLALLYKKQGRAEEALEQLMQARKLNPNSSRIRDALSFFYFENGEYDKAREELNYPNPSPQASLIRGMLYYRDGAPSQAVAELKRAYTGEAPSPRLMTLVNLGQALVQIGNYPEAEIYLEQARKKEPENPSVLNAVGGLYLETGRYREAREILEKSLEDDPDQPQVRQSLDQVDRVLAAS